MVGALLLGFVCGVIARVLMPGDAFRNMSGPASWLVSVGLGLAGALVGYVIFTLGLGIGDTDIFDWGGLLGAIIGTLVVLGLAGYFLRRRQIPQPSHPDSPGTKAHDPPPEPSSTRHLLVICPGRPRGRSPALSILQLCRAVDPGYGCCSSSCWSPSMPSPRSRTCWAA